MTIQAHSSFSLNTSSREAGIESGESITGALGDSLKLVVVYLTDNHAHRDFLRGIREVVGQDVSVVGCSGQGVMGRGQVVEDAYAAGVMGLGGERTVAKSGSMENVQENTREKGAALGAMLKSVDGAAPKVTVIHYDPLCGLNVDELLIGLSSELTCPILGGAAGHAFFFAPLKETFQYCGGEVLQNSAVGFSLAGDFSVEHGISHGCSPIGLDLVVTKAEGNRLIELDGRPAMTVWEEFCDTSDIRVNRSTDLAIGIPVKQGETTEYRMRGAYAMDPDNGVMMPTAMTEGMVVSLHHRTVANIMDGTRAMAETIKRRLGDRNPRAVLGFECGSRAKPFLGMEGSNKENIALQSIIGPDAAWVGMLAWGELYPTGGEASFHNYAYPLLVLAD